MKAPITPTKPILKAVSTSCNNVALGAAPYNYSGVVKSGYLSTARGNSALAFIFYGKEGVALPNVKNFPTLIWLNGGPGSSSQLGNLMELGPFWIVPDAAEPYKIVRNNFTWVKEYNIMFVDQPVGTGLSYADPTLKDPYVHNMTGNYPS
jgi:vitellogenic carboxypeptidase-like protein